jgi:hypothetical protein
MVFLLFFNKFIPMPYQDTIAPHTSEQDKTTKSNE